MSTITTTVNRGDARYREAPLAEDPPVIPHTPREGWLTLVAAVLMVFAVAAAVDDARWAGTVVGSTDSQTNFLLWAAPFSVLLGAWLARKGWRPIVSHLVGATVGAAFLLFSIANVVSQAPALEQRLHDLNVSVSTFGHQVFVLGSGPSRRRSSCCHRRARLGCGPVRGYGVFRRHRAGPAHCPRRADPADQRLDHGPRAVPAPDHLRRSGAAAGNAPEPLRAGARLALARHARCRRDIQLVPALRRAMVVAILTASILLAANASSAPLSRVWTSFDDQLLDIGYGVNRLLGGVTGRGARPEHPLHAEPDHPRLLAVVGRAGVQRARVSDGVGRRWRGATYDSFDGRGWQQLDREDVLIDAGAAIPGQIGRGHSERPSAGTKSRSRSRRPTSAATSTSRRPFRSALISRARSMTNGAGGPFLRGKLAAGVQSGVPYTVESRVRKPPASSR